MSEYDQVLHEDETTVSTRKPFNKFRFAENLSNKSRQMPSNKLREKNSPKSSSAAARDYWNLRGKD